MPTDPKYQERAVALRCPVCKDKLGACHRLVHLGYLEAVAAEPEAVDREARVEYGARFREWELAQSDLVAERDRLRTQLAAQVEAGQILAKLREKDQAAHTEALRQQAERIAEGCATALSDARHGHDEIKQSVRAIIERVKGEPCQTK